MFKLRLLIFRKLEEYWESSTIINLTDENKRKLKSDLEKMLAALSIAQFGAPKDLNHVKNVYGSRKLDDLLISHLLFTVISLIFFIFI